MYKKAKHEVPKGDDFVYIQKIRIIEIDIFTVRQLNS